MSRLLAPGAPAAASAAEGRAIPRCEIVGPYLQDGNPTSNETDPRVPTDEAPRLLRLSRRRCRCLSAGGFLSTGFLTPQDVPIDASPARSKLGQRRGAHSARILLLMAHNDAELSDGFARALKARCVLGRRSDFEVTVYFAGPIDVGRVHFM
jgi:hypothetical protein